MFPLQSPWEEHLPLPRPAQKGDWPGLDGGGGGGQFRPLLLTLQLLLGPEPRSAWRGTGQALACDIRFPWAGAVRCSRGSRPGAALEAFPAKLLSISNVVSVSFKGLVGEIGTRLPLMTGFLIHCPSSLIFVSCLKQCVKNSHC